METNEMVVYKNLTDKIFNEFHSLKTPDAKIMFINNLKDGILKPIKERIAELEKEYIDCHRGDRVIIGESLYFVAEKKTDRYNTEAVYKACQGNIEQLIAVLPKNPAFNKTPILKLQESSGAELWHEDVEEKLQVKSCPKKLLNLKEVNN
jgi:hypothetical protein